MALKLLVGADPECFLRDIKTGSIVSAHPVLPGTKLEPYKVPKGAIQVDGAAAEFNIDPASNHVEFVHNIRQVMFELREHTKEYVLVLDPTVTFEPTYFNTLPTEVRELGCNPDFNAWTGQVNPAPDGSATTMRTASGHIHLGWTKNVNPMDKIHFEDCCTVIKQMDYFIGLYSLMWDTDNKRRQLYGKAGAFRPKPYGAEYRTMSNVWLRSELVQSWIFNAAVTGINQLLSSKKSFYEQFGDFAKDCIDNNKVDWFKTETGQQIHNMTGLGWPDFKSCWTKVDLEKVKLTVNKPNNKVSNWKYAGLGQPD